MGVTATGKYQSVFEQAREFLYVPLTQHPRPAMTLIVKTYGDPSALAAPLRELVRSLDANLPVFSVITMASFFEQRSVKLVNMIDEVVGSIGPSGWAWRWLASTRWWRIRRPAGRARSEFVWLSEQRGWT